MIKIWPLAMQDWFWKLFWKTLQEVNLPWENPKVSCSNGRSTARWQELLGFNPLHHTQTSFALSRTRHDRATISQWALHTLDLNPWRQRQEFSWKFSSTNTAFCCYSRYRASIFLAADKGWENKSCPFIIFILWGKHKKKKLMCLYTHS